MTTTGTLYDLRIGSSYIEVLLRQVLLGLFEEVRSDAWILFDFNLRGWAFFLSALDLRLFSPPTVWIKYVLHWKKGKRNLVRCWFLPWVFYNWEKDEWRTGCLLSSVGPSLWLVLCSCWTGFFEWLNPHRESNRNGSVRNVKYMYGQGLNCMCYTLHILHFWASLLAQQNWSIFVLWLELA